MLKRLTAACLLSFAGLGAAAQLPDSADMSAGGEFRRRIDRHTSTKAYRMLFVGTPLIVGGVVMQAYDSDFRRLRNGYSRSFRHDYDDWLQYAPAGAMVALKACGVRGRSSWGRMLVSDAFSAGLMAIGVNSLKYSCRVMRPDGSSRNSFPSGHTATAFMAATMLHKEYGHRSPWYSIGGYTVATVTGVTRQLNNRHWMSDIMVGAGIGILATELGYFLADLIFKEKGLNVTETYSVYDRCRRPSFLGFSLGFSTVPGSYTPYPGMHMQFLSGPAVSVQGAWFATPYWGFGGRMSCTNLRVKVNGVAQNDNLECASMYAGPYFSHPFSMRWLVGAKLLGGCEIYKPCRTPYPGMHMQFLSGPAVSVQGAWFATPYWGFGGRMSCTNLRVKVNGVAQNDNLECASMYAGPYFSHPFSMRWLVGAKLLGGCEIYKPCRTDFRRLERRAGFSFGTGLSTTYLATQNLGVRFSTDYDVAPPVVRSSRERLHKLTFSMEVCAVF